MTPSEIIRLALEEDIAGGDHTSLSTIPDKATGSARLLIKQQGVLAGMIYAREVFRQVDPALEFDEKMADGTVVKPGDVPFIIRGAARSILQGERLSLNILQRLSGIATSTAQLVKLVAPFGTRLLDTRKTTPLLREMEKYAVRMGGGRNHRMGLYDMIMIKDNHVDFAGGISSAIDRVNNYLREKELDLKIEIEVRNFEELEAVMEHGGVDRIMLDNFSPVDLAAAVNRINGKYETEASGGINARNIEAYAATGVDFISSGAITHQIMSLDMSLKATFSLQG
ncbi:MAG TPA: carboxylating nicotinate-nucleotide diphosphorylase [Bacteroidales bacterium]|nr:carboxylating nicotinate-nucleotide diphosphorylase [Bacteroidales bacterium]HRZ50125.1 carboxylating nicotinate-nucleotide diphosphorylase [Bacteroidales bacterium]